MMDIKRFSILVTFLGFCFVGHATEINPFLADGFKSVQLNFSSRVIQQKFKKDVCSFLFEDSPSAPVTCKVDNRGSGIFLEVGIFYNQFIDQMSFFDNLTGKLLSHPNYPQNNNPVFEERAVFLGHNPSAGVWRNTGNLEQFLHFPFHTNRPIPLISLGSESRMVFQKYSALVEKLQRLDWRNWDQILPDEIPSAQSFVFWNDVFDKFKDSARVAEFCLSYGWTTDITKTRVGTRGNDILGVLKRDGNSDSRISPWCSVLKH